MAASQKEEKEQFFSALYQLDHLSDNEAAPIPTLVRSQHPPTANITPEAVPVPRRSVPSIVPKVVPLQRSSASKVASEVESPEKPRTRTRRPTTARPPPPLVSLKSSKGKKSAKSTSIPEAKRIFTGSTFYFIPNNDAAGPRKMRIQRALQYGAVWERVWSAEVTHVIVDSNITMTDVLRHYRVDKLPEDAVVVNDVWLTESIGYREMRDPDAKRFRIQGSVDAVVPKIPAVAETREPIEEEAEQAVEQASQRSEEDEVERQNSTASSRHDTPAVLDDSNIGPRDVLDEIIREMKDMQGLPLDLDDDHTTTASTSFDGSDSDSSRSNKPPRRKKSKKMAAKNQFMCMEKHDGANSNSNLNARTIGILQKMASYYDRIGDTWRTLAYRRCMTALRRETRLVATKEEALQIPNIGERLAAKIEEIVTTNTLRRLETTATDPNDQLLHLFMGIYQVGYSSASRWIAQGHRTLEDLKTKADLTPNQRIGVEHYDDFLQRIPRAEVLRHAEVVGKVLRDVDPKLQAIVGGSYRRGNTDSGDIDMLITKEGASLANIRTVVLGVVVPLLTKQGFLKAALAAGTARADSGSKWHGASALPGSNSIWRRIDLLFVPWNEVGAALIYFTGNDIFNRSMRLLASKKGMRLNQRGLYADVMRGQRRERITEGKLLEGQSEEKIFDLLGVPWRPPEHRKC